MTLNRRYARNIRENLSFYLSSTVLTVATLLMFFLFSIAGRAILDFSEEFFATQCLEDANFTTYLPISDEDIADLESRFGVTLERQRLINIETDGVTARVFERTEKIDLYDVTEGRDVAHDGEMIISEGFAVNMGVAIGDSLQIGDSSYTVTGFFQRPDYLYMLENDADSYKNITTFYLAYMTDDDFERLGETDVHYLVRYGDADDTEFRRAIHETYYIRNYTAATENQRIVLVNSQAEMFVIMSYLILVIMPLIAVALVSIIIGRKVKSEQRMIGTLSSLGYTKGQLMRHYAGFAALPGLVGGIIMVLIAMVAAQPYSELGLQDYEPMRVVGRLLPLDAVLGIVVPTAMYILAAILSVRKLLKKDTVLLLNGSADATGKKRRRIWADKPFSFRKKLAVRSVVGNPGRSFVVLLGVFLGSFIMLFGLAMIDSLQGVVGEAESSLGSYEYQYVLNELAYENPYGGEALLISSLEDEGGRSLILMGTEPDNPYLAFRDAAGNTVDIDGGFYITSLVELLFDWHAGDTVALYHPLTLEKTEVRIDGVVKNNVTKAIYTSTARAAELAGLEAGVFNALISDTKLDIPSSKVAQESHKADLGDQVQTMLDQMGFMIDLLIGLGAIICIAAIYVAVNMLVTENRGNISMLKVLGYRDRQIDHIVLDMNHIFLPLGIVLSIPAVYGCCNLFFLLFADMDGLLITTCITPLSYVIGIGLTVISYFISLQLVRRKVKRVDMVECLKDNRE